MFSGPEGIQQNRTPHEELLSLESKIPKLNTFTELAVNDAELREILSEIDPELPEKLRDLGPKFMERLRTLEQRSVQIRADGGNMQ